MLISPINNSMNFQARIKINKSNLKDIVESTAAGSVVAGTGSAAVASLAAQTDFDAAISQYAIPSTAYKGSTLPLINELNADESASNKLMGISLSAPLSLQGSGYSGIKILDALSGDKISDTIDNLNLEKSKEVVALNTASAIVGGLNASEPINVENAATLATTAVPVAILDTAAISDAYEKSKSNNKKIPS